MTKSDYLGLSIVSLKVISAFSSGATRLGLGLWTLVEQLMRCMAQGNAVALNGIIR